MQAFPVAFLSEITPSTQSVTCDCYNVMGLELKYGKTSDILRSKQASDSLKKGSLPEPENQRPPPNNLVIYSEI